MKLFFTILLLASLFAANQTSAQWQLVYQHPTSTTMKVSSIVMHDDVVFAAASTLILRSTNYGAAWTHVASLGGGGPLVHNGSALVGGGVSYYSATDTNLIYSNDDGDTWTKTHAFVSASYLSAVTGLVQQADTLYAIMGGVSDPNLLFRSLDNGVTWISCGVSTDRGISIAADANNVYVGTEYHAVYRYTTDHVWEQMDTVGLPIYIGDLYQSAMLHMVNDVLWAAIGNHVFRYDAANQHWVNVHDFGSGLGGILSNVGNTLISGANGFSYSTDNGATWLVDTAGLGYVGGGYLIKSFGVMNDTIYAGTITSKIYKRAVSDLSGTSSVLAKSPKQITVIVFPNPFTDRTTMRIYGVENSEVTLFNALGQAVKTIDVPGSLVIIDRAGLPAGMYSYKVKSKGTVMSNGKLLIQ